MTITLLLSLFGCFPQATPGNVSSDSADTAGDSDADSDSDTDTDTDSDSDSDTDTDTDTDTSGDTSTDTGDDTGTDTGSEDTAAVGDTNYGPGDVYVNEFMANSHPIEDAVGEWLELVNTSGKDLDLKGLLLSDLDGTSPQSVTIDQHVLLPSGGYVVLGNNDDKATNGGVTVAWEWDAVAFQLGNDGDEIVLTANANTIDSVAYEETAWAMVKGVSAQRDADRLDAASSTDPASWCAGTSTFGADNQVGTPGAANDDCGK